MLQFLVSLFFQQGDDFGAEHPHALFDAVVVGVGGHAVKLFHCIFQ